DGALADIPLLSTGSGQPLLLAQLPLGFGLEATGYGAPRPAGTSLEELLRAIQLRAFGADQSLLTGGATGFLHGLPQTLPLVVQTLTPTLTPGASPPATPLVLQGPDAGASVALIIDASGLPPGVVLQLDNIAFAAVVGSVGLVGGQGSQAVWGDGASQFIHLGEGDDELHGGGGADTIGSAGGADRLYGDDGDDV